MEIQEDREGGITILQPVGRIDTNTAGDFESKIVELLGGGAKQLVIDLVKVDYISSAGLRVLLMAAKRLKSMNGNMILCSMSDHIKEVFDIAGFTPIFTIEPSREEAMERL